MSDKRDYYEVLQVTRTATESEISVAYRKLAIQFHPDKNPGDEKAVIRFKEAAEAYEILSDHEKRARYDRYGYAGVNNPGSPHFGDVNDIFEAFGDIFGDIFGGSGGRRGGRRARRGGDVRSEVNIDLFEAARGVSKTIKYRRHEKCEECQATGASKGSKPTSCGYCGGHGQVIQTAGLFRMQTTCPSCQGSGQVIKDPCRACSGHGYVEKTVTRDVAIPAGVDSQTQLRLTGEGDPSTNGGPPGDCYVFITVKPHPLFERDGQDLICRMPISYSQAVLGATVEVPTIEGTEDLKIPAGTQPGDVLKVRGRGMPTPRGRGVGDLLVEMVLEVPKKLSPKQKELLRELAEEEKVNVSPDRKSFFDRVKEYFVSEESQADEKA